MRLLKSRLVDWGFCIFSAWHCLTDTCTLPTVDVLLT